jgi:hypothetical protein
VTVCSSGCQCTTISGALAAANSGENTLIRPGSYAGGLTVDKSVSLIGAGATQTTITGGGPVLSVNSGVSATLGGPHGHRWFQRIQWRWGHLQRRHADDQERHGHRAASPLSPVERQHGHRQYARQLLLGELLTIAFA